MKTDFIIRINYKSIIVFKKNFLLLSFYLTAYVLTSEKLSARGVKMAALEPLPCRLVIVPKAPLNRLHVHAHVHRRVSRKPDINQNDQSGTALSKTICISYEP